MESFEEFEKATKAAEFIQNQDGRRPHIAIVLGSGLGDFAERLENATGIPFEEIPYFARSTVEGHKGRLVIGELQGIPIICQQGRFHFYEGYELDQIVFPIRVYGRLGIKVVILTNAAGSLDPELRPGSLMLITDHINCMGVNALRGKNDERFGPRFPDMTNVYDRELSSLVDKAANEMASEGLGKGSKDFLNRGIYCATSGPTYETPAEVRMFRLFGANAVGMSTVPEAVAARHQGLRVIAISCISNYAAGMTGEPINHQEVMDAGRQVAELFSELISRTVKSMNSVLLMQ
ncbi:MAG TPA: purine-nucleoside phosphorylase [Pyrinomonadaceae bacterium]|nr:purine-nucleoside phosphorylase [Pyrinomonadaceae bacterium]